jgi:lipopolysaccharide/colanic/teichoic acid biosynthesis glycosyltransferase
MPLQPRAGLEGRCTAVAWAGGGGASKRLLDIVLAAVLGVILLPLIVVLAIAIKLESAGPVFYRSRRVGSRGDGFSMLKFRKMHARAAGPKLTLLEDPRLTRLGVFLARTKLDELPQLWNVVRGDMSLVGPRPEDAVFVQHQKDVYRTILRVRPGITGLSQLAFAMERKILRRENFQEDYINRLLPQKARIDSLYAERRTLLMDLRILAWTAPVLFGLELAVNRDNGKVTHRRGRGGRRGAGEKLTPSPERETLMMPTGTCPVNEP